MGTLTLSPAPRALHCPYLFTRKSANGKESKMATNFLSMMATNFLGNSAASAAKRAVFYQFQDDCIGPDPLADGAFDWPDLNGGVVLSREQAIRGWRVWGVVDAGGISSAYSNFARARGPRLVAPYLPQDLTFTPPMWVPGRNRASAQFCAGKPSEGHPGGDGFCRCGFRVVRSWTVMEAYLLHALPARQDELLATAEVEVWGRIAPGSPDDDFQHVARVEWAEIRCLYLVDTPAAMRVAPGLAEHYGCDVHLVGSR